MWWNAPTYDGTVATALGHLNEARDSDGPAVDKCDLYFKALNQLWNGLGHLMRLTHSDTPRLIALLQALPPEGSVRVLGSQELGNLLMLEPLVMNHFRLNDHGYRPGDAISSVLLKKATEEHADLKKRHTSWREQRCDVDRVLKSLAEFLYVVRSNIAHGEKTPYGPDFEKARRDEQVALTVIPLQEILLNELLDRPSEKLVVYGTLKPGEVNASVLHCVPGEWRNCTIRGWVQPGSDIPEFRWDSTGGVIRAMMLTSLGLKAEWSRIDRFEGARYKRRLVPVLLESARSVANCYVVN